MEKSGMSRVISGCRELFARVGERIYIGVCMQKRVQNNCMS